MSEYPNVQSQQAPVPAQPSAAVYPQAVYDVVVRRPKGLSITSMVLGLVSIAAGFTFVIPVISLILGILGLRKEPAGRAMALTGVIISSLILLVWVVIIGAGILLGIGVFGAAASSSTGY